MKTIEKYFIGMKKKKRPIAMLTCYDAEMSKLLNEAGIEVILVGDSAGMVKLGFSDTLPVTVDDMLLFTRAVKRGNSKAHIIADMPFINKKKTKAQVLKDAKRLVGAGADSVKIEVFCGEKVFNSKNRNESIDIIKHIIKSGIPVMGHIGLTPQYVKEMGGYKVQGRDEHTAEMLMNTALELEKAGVYSVLMECIPAELAGRITKALKKPTIGIGAGIGCSGQVLVLDDIFAVPAQPKKKFVKQYADVRSPMLSGVKQYIQEVTTKKFPKKEHSFQ